MTPIETVQQIYAAFGRGDVPYILSQLADDVEWEYATFPNPVPWLQPLQGRDRVPTFFDALLSRVEMNVFSPRQFFADARTVVDLVDVEFTVKATGKRVVEPEAVHIWHFDDAGKVARFRHRVDTWQSALALQGD
ncbi:nuclear transport factor 2 family protein [Azohydromonas sp.]|uniref:nuclear transport factor 2 family protein n=1 Tax=Azohydromonas sp. TaxID=1872666 RepID=UPI002BB2B698|nr:nuclear transport factor 2 family protein [Azohydromonas sp.]HMM86553.1 nuclear transport factor 2 family protein [Azohydromonas sp.]